MKVAQYISMWLAAIRSDGKTHKLLPWLLAVPTIVWQSIFFVGPLLFLIAVTFWQVKAYRLRPAFVFDNWGRILTSSSFYDALGHSLLMALIATLFTLLLAFPAAYTIAFKLNKNLKNLAVFSLIIPIFSSYILRIYAWQIILSPTGIINKFLNWFSIPSLDLLGTATSLQIGFLTLSLPIAILILVFALSGVDKALIEAAENMGCKRWKIISFVLIPSIKPAIILAVSSAFILCFGDYISPVFMMGSNPPTLSILLVDTIKSGSQWPRGAVVGIAMLFVISTFLLLLKKLDK